jgi:uroporphyrinogen-III synthase
VLMPRAERGGREIAQALRVAGARVDEVVAYRTVARPVEEIVTTWRRAWPAAAVITSPSAARALVGALGQAALRSLDGVIAIGPTTAAELAQLGIDAVVSESSDFASVARRTRDLLIEPATRRNVPAGAAKEN